MHDKHDLNNPAATHFDDCGCLSERLKAENKKLEVAIEVWKFVSDVRDTCIGKLKSELAVCLKLLEIAKPIIQRQANLKNSCKCEAGSFPYEPGFECDLHYFIQKEYELSRHSSEEKK